MKLRRKTLLAVLAVVLSVSVACGSSDDSPGGVGPGATTSPDARLADRESFTPDESFDPSVTVAEKVDGFEPAALAGKWVSSSGTGVDLAVRVDYGRVEGLSSSGEAFVLTLAEDKGYRISYLTKSNGGLCFGGAVAAEIGTWSSDGKTLVLAPSATRGQTCCADCADAAAARVARTYTVSRAMLESASGANFKRRRVGLVLSGPCAEYMPSLGGSTCTTGSAVEVRLQRVAGTAPLPAAFCGPATAASRCDRCLLEWCCTRIQECAAGADGCTAMATCGVGCGEEQSCHFQCAASVGDAEGAFWLARCAGEKCAASCRN